MNKDRSWIENKIINRLNLLKDIENPRHIYKCVSFSITRKCPLECRRCYFCGSKDGESIDIEDAKRIMENFPNDLESIYITGGEPFSDIELLFRILEIIKERGFSELTRIAVHTTGFWVKDKDYAKKICKRLIESGVNFFAMGTFDRWHYEAGLEKEKPELLLNILKNDFSTIELDSGKSYGYEDLLREVFSSKLYVRPMASNAAVPVGRAMWVIKEKEKTIYPEPSFMCRGFLDTEYGYDYFINFNGELHFCSWYTAKPVGNIVKEPFDILVKRAKQDRLLCEMQTEGNMIDVAAKHFKLSKERAVDMLKEKGNCGFCTSLFIDYFKERDDKPIMHKIYEIEKKKYEKCC